MKRKLLVFMLCLTMLCVPFLKVQAEESNLWRYQVENGTAYITHYRGDTSGHVEIPATIDGYTVTKIGNSAFLGDEITSVTIPDTMVEIGEATFAHCPNLVTVKIPKSVTQISESAFMDCESLTGFEVDLQNQYYAHDAMGVLYTKNLLNLIQVPGAKEGKFVVPNGVMYIGGSAFYGCSRLTEIVIAETVQIIGGYAFYDCTGLTQLDLPASVQYIGNNAFGGCEKLTRINVAQENPYFCSDESGTLYSKDKSEILYVPGSFAGDYVVPDGTTQIGPDFFEGCEGLISVTIPEGVTSIGHYAFHGCRNLERVTIAESVSEIDAYAFEGCNKLKAVNIPEQVTHIRWGLFSRCESLTQLPIHDKVTIIDDHAFAYCNGLTNIVIPASVEYVGHFAFFDCRGLENVYFCGDAPEFVNHENINGSFAATTATAYYHQGTEGWTEENKSKTGGSITWVELEHIVFDEGPDARCVVCGELAEKNTTIDPETPDEGTDVPPTQDVPKEEPPQAEVPKEENPKTADRIADLAGIILIVLAAGCMLLLKQPSKNTKV